MDDDTGMQMTLHGVDGRSALHPDERESLGI